MRDTKEAVYRVALADAMFLHKERIEKQELIVRKAREELEQAQNQLSKNRLAYASFLDYINSLNNKKAGW